MTKFFKAILNHRKTVILLFLIVIVLSVIGYTMVGRNSDIVSYLPEGSDTNVGKESLSEYFKIEGDFAVALTNVDREYVNKFIAEVEKSKLVKQTTWLGRFDSMLDILNDPSQANMHEAIKKSYETVSNKFYKADTDTYMISVYYNESNSSNNVIDHVKHVEKYLGGTIGENGAFHLGGGAVNAKLLLDSSIGEMPKFLAVAVICILVVLLFATKSFFEPLIFLVTLGVSIIVNLGTNIIIGEISSITFSASAILQLALAMDYSIFLMHSYYEEKEIYLDNYSALLSALPKTLKSVSSSALTTVAGFVALFMIEFRLGFDLGFVLAKGVTLSLITVMVLQPVLIMMSGKMIEKTKHKEIKLSFKRTANISQKAHKPIILIALFLIVPCFIFQFLVPLNYITTTESNPNPSVPEQVLLQESNQVILVIPMKGKNLYEQLKTQYKYSEDLLKIENIDEVFSIATIIPFDLAFAGIGTNNPAVAPLRQGFLSEKMDYMLYTVTIDALPEDELSYATLEKIRTLSNDTFGDVYVTGLTQGAFDLAKITPRDFAMVSILSALFIFIILLLTFKSFSLSMILLMVIELGIFFNLTLVYLSGSMINFMSYIIISSIQLGATVDYAILYACKYKEALKQCSDPFEAIKTAVKKACPPIFSSASVLIVACLAVYFVTTNMIVSEITMLIARGSIFSIILVTVLLPSILYALNKFKIAKANRKKALKSNGNSVLPL